MKTVLSRAVALCLAIVTMLALASCGNQKFASIQDYINSEEVQSEIEKAKSQAETSGMEAEVTGEGNKMIYSYTFTVDVPANAAATLASGIESQASTFKTIANSLKLVVNVENPTVVVRYLDKNGDEIYSKEFPAD